MTTRARRARAPRSGNGGAILGVMPRAPRLAVAPVASTAPADGGDQVVVLRDVP